MQNNDNSGKIRNISVCDNFFKGSQVGFGIKATGKEGLIEDVEVKNLKMKTVSCCIYLDGTGKPASWEKGYSTVRKIRISEVTAVTGAAPDKRRIAFWVEGAKELPFEDFLFENMQLQVKEYGTIANVRNLRFVNVAVEVV